MDMEKIFGICLCILLSVGILCLSAFLVTKTVVTVRCLINESQIDTSDPLYVSRC